VYFGSAILFAAGLQIASFGAAFIGAVALAVVHMIIEAVL